MRPRRFYSSLLFSLFSCLCFVSLSHAQSSSRVEGATNGPKYAVDPHCPKNEHGIDIDPQNYVWLGSNDAADHMILKFKSAGKFLLHIGSPGKRLGGHCSTQLG